MNTLHKIYYSKCLLDLYRAANIKQLGGDYFDVERQLYRIALSEVVAFIEQTTVVSEQEILLFKISHLKKIYCQIVEHLAGSVLPEKDVVRTIYMHIKLQLPINCQG